MWGGSSDGIDRHVPLRRGVCSAGQAAGVGGASATFHPMGMLCNWLPIEFGGPQGPRLPPHRNTGVAHTLSCEMELNRGRAGKIILGGQDGGRNF